MGTLITVLLVSFIGAWFLYSIYRMWKGANGKDCASCSLGGGFDYAMSGEKKRVPVKTEFVTAAGHHIMVDEAAARKRRERIRKMMEGK